MLRLSHLVTGILIAAAMAAASLIDHSPAAAQSPVTVVTLYAMNLRSGPGMQYPAMAVVSPGVTLSADARSADSAWARTAYGGKVGWLYAAMVSISGDFAALPVADASSTPASAPPATPGPPPNGTIESLTPYVSTERAVYYRLAYWSDGLLINGFYGEPKSGGPHAAVIYNRGGNRDVGTLTGVELAPFAEVGMVVVASQLRGGAGSQGRDEFGGADLDDVLSLIGLLKGRPAVDPNRIVMIGGSRGGMMTYLALKAQARAGSHDIKAAAAVSGLADLFSWAQEHPEITNDFYPDIIGTTPAQDPAPFIARSATYWPWLIQAPLLLEHGEADATVSASQSRRLYRLIRANGGTAKLILYSDGDHGLSNHLGGVPEALHWFQYFIGLPGDNFDFASNADAIAAAQAALYAAR